VEAFGVMIKFKMALPWKHFEFLNPQKLLHTTVDIPTKFHEA
jgi:hypothetical protein